MVTTTENQRSKWKNKAFGREKETTISGNSSSDSETGKL